MNGQVVGFKLEDGTNLSVGEAHLAGKGIIDYSFSEMGQVLNSLKDKTFINNIGVKDGSEGWGS